MSEPAIAPAPVASSTALADSMAQIQVSAVENIEGLSFLDDPPAPSAKPVDPPAPDPVGDEIVPPTTKPAKKGSKEPVAKGIDPDAVPEDPPGQTTEKAKVGWGELRSELKAKSAEVETLKSTYETQLAELREKLSKLPDIEEKAKFADEAEKELAIHRVESSREYKQLVTEPIERIADRAAAMAKKFELAESDVFAALEERDPERRDELLDGLMAGMRDASKLSLVNMANDTQAILDQKEKLHAKALEAKGQLEKITAEKSAAEKAEHAKKYQASIAKTAKDFAAKIPFVEIKEGETADAVFDAIAKNAKDTEFDAVNPEVQAFSVAAGLTLPRVVAQLKHVLKEKAALEARLSEYSSASPSAQVRPSLNQVAADLGAGWYPGKR